MPYIDSRVLQCRKDFASWFLQTAVPESRIISIDESSFDFDMFPHSGISPRGQRVCGTRRSKAYCRRFSLLLAISNQDIVGYQIRNGSYNGELFASFIQSLQLHDNDVIIADNASIHKTKKVAEAILEKGTKIKYTSPYSPDLNPVELAFAKIKSTYRANARRVWCEQYIHDAIQSLSHSNLKSYFDHCLHIATKICTST